MSSSSLLTRLNLDKAAQALLRGKVIAFPTETFYGLGCDAMNADAVANIFVLKRRSLSNPVPVVINSLAMLDIIAKPVVGAAKDLVDAFWPGSLSIVLAARPEVPDLLTAGVGRVAVRFSPHPAPLALCKAVAGPIVASSANISGDAPVHNPDDINPELFSGLDGVFVEGPEPCGLLPSTVVEIRERPGKSIIRILRPGAVATDALEAAGFTVIQKN